MACFKDWIEEFTQEVPSMTGRTSTPASDEVKRTGLQPQVDAQEIDTKSKHDQDKILSIDANLERIDSEMPKTGSAKISKFRKLWDKLIEKWEKIKVADEEGPMELDQEDGLGSHQPDQNFLQAFQRHPNMILTGDRNMHGSGLFGNG